MATSITWTEMMMVFGFGASVFVFTFFRMNKFSSFLKAKSLDRKEETIKYLELMSAEFNEKKLTLLMYVLSFGLGGGIFLLFLPEVALGLILGVAVGILGWSIPLVFVKASYEKRCNLFVSQMVDALTIMANGIKSGSSPFQAMQRLVESMENPIAFEFSKVISQVQRNQSLEEALVDLAKRIPKPDVEMFVAAVNILKVTGGDMPETFQTIVHTIRERQKVERKIQAVVQSGLVTGYIITMAPALIALILFFVAPDMLKPMFNTTMGLVILSCILAMQIAGGIWIKKIVTIKV
jgi:tight adherence protein B